MTSLPFSATTPRSIGRVGLRARDAGMLADYYKSVVGLVERGRDGGTIELGSSERTILEIESAPDAKPDDPRSAGLFHNAFLLPSRADLARWTRHAIEKRLKVDGASDHLVSEAIYLTDPEGNGIEIYADRPKESWKRNSGGIEMATLALDFDSLLAEPGSEGEWAGMPAGGVMGHVHLRVGDVKLAESWWHEALGFETMTNYGGSAIFLASGGYHHHIGTNIWQSRGSGPRDGSRSGLSWIAIEDRTGGASQVLADPWGTEVRIEPAG